MLEVDEKLHGNGLGKLQKTMQPPWTLPTDKYNHSLSDGCLFMMFFLFFFFYRFSLSNSPLKQSRTKYSW